MKSALPFFGYALLFAVPATLLAGLAFQAHQVSNPALQILLTLASLHLGYVSTVYGLEGVAIYRGRAKP